VCPQTGLGLREARNIWRSIRGALAQVRLVAFCLFLAGTAYPQRQIAQDPGVVAALQVLDAWLHGKAAQLQLPSLSVAIVFDQELVWAKAYGNASPRALYPLGVGIGLLTLSPFCNYATKESSPWTIL
jgi:hypothetical protein